jgi:hypothetical protein
MRSEQEMPPDKTLTAISPRLRSARLAVVVAGPGHRAISSIII